MRYEIACPTVVERPDWLLHQLQEAVRAPRNPADLSAAHESTRLRAEARLIATLGNSSLTRRRLARAQRVFPLREGSEAATIGVPIAGLRRLGLHLGQRLGLYRPDDVFDLTFDEVRGLLRDPGHVDDPASVALQRREEREKVAATPTTRAPGTWAPAVAALDLRGFRRRAATENLAALRLVRRAGRPTAGCRPPGRRRARRAWARAGGPTRAWRGSCGAKTTSSGSYEATSWCAPRPHRCGRWSSR